MREQRMLQKFMMTVLLVGKSSVGWYWGVRMTTVLVKILQSEQHTVAIEKTE
jgi:hypothetical protein